MTPPAGAIPDPYPYVQTTTPAYGGTLKLYSAEPFTTTREDNAR